MPTLLLIFALSVGIVSATEVDNFTIRENIPDSTAWLNQRMNQVLKDAAAATKGCDLGKLHREIYNRVGGGLYAKAELWSSENPSVRKIPIPQSIYQKISKGYFSKFGILPVKFEKFYTENNLRVGESIIGDDKLGHFASAGYSIFHSVRKRQGSPLPDVQGLLEKYGDLRFGVKGFLKATTLEGDALALRMSNFLEDGQWGTSGPGVKSFGDVVANWEGYKFWSSLTEGSRPYLSCGKQKFLVLREFLWEDYISPGWDEAINCSLRVAPIKLALKNIPTCPLKIGPCQALRLRYDKLAPQLLGPGCL